MLDKPEIVQTEKQLAAVIRLTIPREAIQSAMGPAIGEVMAAVAAQGLTPTGPVFSHHLKMDPAIFDFEVGVPVASPIAPAGRVQASELPAAKVARTIYRGPYEGLGQAWGEFCGWVKAEKLQPQASLWECYVVAPDSSPNPADWQTQLNQPLAG